KEIQAAINTCSPAESWSHNFEEYDALFIKITNVLSNQNWWHDERFQPGSTTAYSNYGFVTPRADLGPNYGNKFVEETWGPISSGDCWSIDVEVASDGTKTF